MKRTEEKVIKTIARHDLITRGDRILVSLSGGADSVFLLYFLNKFSKKYHCQLGAFHLNHMLRGKDADDDEQFCSDFCSHLNIPFYSIRKRVQLIAKKKKISFEEAGREVRYDELQKSARKHGYNKIATAHNSGDNTETILLNLVKGTGLKGLSGIPVSRENIIRPLISLKKEEILRYLEKNKISYRTDKSNESEDYERNFIRLKIIPLIKQKLNPSLEDTLLSTSQILSDIAAFLDKMIDKEFIKIKRDIIHLKIPLKFIIAFYPELRGILLKRLLERNFSVSVTFNDIRAIQDLISNEPGKLVHISGGLVCFRERDSLFVTLKDEIPGIQMIIEPGKKVKVNGNEISITYKKNSLMSCDKLREYISADNLQSEVFVLRNWKAGDKFFPFGMRGSKSIADFLTDNKIEPSQKKKQLVLLNNDKIVWVVGERLDNRFRTTPHTKKIIELCLKKN